MELQQELIHLIQQALQPKFGPQGVTSVAQSWTQRASGQETGQLRTTKVLQDPLEDPVILQSDMAELLEQTLQEEIDLDLGQTVSEPLRFLALKARRRNNWNTTSNWTGNCPDVSGVVAFGMYLDTGNIPSWKALSFSLDSTGLFYIL